VDDNSLHYLGADNPDFSWIDEVVSDVREHRLPAYEAAMGVTTETPDSSWVEKVTSDGQSRQLPAYENPMGIQ
jgi:hypothetical protein